MSAREQGQVGIIKFKVAVNQLNTRGAGITASSEEETKHTDKREEMNKAHRPTHSLDNNSLYFHFILK